MVMNRRNGNTGSIQPKIGAEQLVDRGEDRNGVSGSGVGRPSGVRLDGRYQRNTVVGGFQFPVDTKVVAAKCAGADDSDTNVCRRGYRAASAAALPSTAFRQRP